MANKTGLPIPLCQDFECNTTLEATQLLQLEANAQASLGDWHTKVVANSSQRDLLVGYMGNWYEFQEGYGDPTPKQHEYMPSGKNADFYVDYIDTTTYGTTINPAYIQYKDFSFEVNAWDTEFNLLMEVYRRQYEEVTNIAAGGVYQVEEWAESNYSEALGATLWVMNQKIRVEYHDGTSVFALVSQVNNIVDIPLNTRLCAASNNIYQNAANDLLALGYTPPAAGTTRTDFIRVMVINIRGNSTGSVPGVDPDVYFVTGNTPTLPSDYAGVQYVKFSMSKPNC